MMKTFFVTAVLIVGALLPKEVVSQPPLSKRDQKRKAAFEAKIEAEERYEKLLTRADSAFKKRDYVGARMTYERAIKYSPENEQWLKSKIYDLDILMARNIARAVDSIHKMPVRLPDDNVAEIAPPEPKIIPNRTDASPLPRQQADDDVPEKPEVSEPVTPNRDKKSPKNEPPATVENPAPATVAEYADYPQGITDETFEYPDHTVRRVVVKDGIDTSVYKYVTHRWGGKFYFKDDVSVSARIWNEEIARYREKFQENEAD